MKRIISLVCMIAAIAAGWSCGYRLSGSGNNLPPTLKSVAVPAFVNQTTRYQAEQFVTFAVRDEFSKRSKLRLAERGDRADALLEGEITGFQVRPLSQSSEGVAGEYQITITINVRFIDQVNNKLLFENRNLSFVDTYESSNDDFFALESVRLEKIAQRFAASVVSAILENF